MVEASSGIQRTREMAAEHAAAAVAAVSAVGNVRCLQLECGTLPAGAMSASRPGRLQHVFSCVSADAVPKSHEYGMLLADPVPAAGEVRPLQDLQGSADRHHTACADTIKVKSA